MKVTLISPYPDITAAGIRTISAYLKEHGHETQIIILPDFHFDDARYYGVQRYKDSILEEVISLCKGTDLIGITLMTNFFDHAVQITRKLKSKVDIPVIWGGVHPTVCPEESLEYADMVCIGDGEDAMLELVTRMANGNDYSSTSNFWLKSNGRIVKNPLRPLTRNLDMYPIPDYSMKDNHILFEERIEPMTHKSTEFILERGCVLNYRGRIILGHQTLTGRGCPHKCTYCVNDAIKELYKGQSCLRWRSAGHVMKELLWIKEHMPYVGYVLINDDAFFGRNLKSLREFCKEYKEKIELPFACLASPLTLTEEKMALCIDAGLVHIQMGIESGSKRIQKLFNRERMSNERMMRAIRIINKYKDKMCPPQYDFILDVPYEADNDKIENLRFISGIPKPFRIQTFSLILYPGTKLYHMAKADGLISDGKLKAHVKSLGIWEFNYPNLLMNLAKTGLFPCALLKCLISKPLVKVLNSKLLRPLIKLFYVFLKIFRNGIKTIY